METSHVDLLHFVAIESISPSCSLPSLDCILTCESSPSPASLPAVLQSDRLITAHFMQSQVELIHPFWNAYQLMIAGLSMCSPVSRDVLFANSPSCVFQNRGFFWSGFVFLGFLHNRAMDSSDILWQGYSLECASDLIIRWLLSTGKSQNDWKKVNLLRRQLTCSYSSSFPRNNCHIMSRPSLPQKESLSIQIKHVGTPWSESHL